MKERKKKKTRYKAVRPSVAFPRMCIERFLFVLESEVKRDLFPLSRKKRSGGGIVENRISMA